jgi:hypothetical protein
MSTTKLSIAQYLSEKGYTDFTINKSGSFIKVQLWDIITFEEVDKIRDGLNAICGTLTDPKFNWLNVCEFHAGNVRFQK